MKDNDAASIAGFLNADHRRLDQIWNECRTAIASGDIDKLRTHFAQFAPGLRRHIRMEEDVLFPAFEDRTGMREAGPTVVMRAEHKEIQASLDRIDALARSGDRAAVMQAGASEQTRLVGVLRPYNSKEESVLYPMADELFSAEERATLLTRMRNI